MPAPYFTLKTKLTLFFPLAITFVLVSLLFLVEHLQQGSIKALVSNQQYQIVSLLTNEIDHKLRSTRKQLIDLSQKLTPEQFSNPDEALAFLLERTESTHVFDNGVFLFDRQGHMIAELPLGLSRTGKDFSYRDYLKNTFASKTPHISDPYISSQEHHHPAIMLTSPILDSRGNVVAVLGGSIDLMNGGFLGEIHSRKIGKTGYLFLFNTNRMIIAHPDPNRIMKQDIPPGVNLLLDRAINGFEGTDETVNSRGLHALTTFKHLKTKNWIVGANYPIDEAYATIHKLRTTLLFILPFISFTTFWFMRRFLSRFTDPVVSLTNHVETLQQKQGQERMFPSQGNDEIAVLGRTFNSLVLQNDQQREKMLIDLERRKQIDLHLQRQNGYLQALHETTVGLISRHDVAGLLQAIVTRAGNLVGTEHCYVYLKNEAGTEMVMLFQSGIFNGFVHYPIKPGQGIAGRVWNSGQPFHVDDYRLWEGRLTDPDRDQLHAMAGVPLKTGNAVVGVLGLAFVDPDIVFNDEQMDLLARFGELASLALENARLNEESRRELAERKKAEEHLRKLSVAVEQSPVSIIITDTSGRIEYVNPHFTALTGYHENEIVGKTPAVLKTGETSPEEYRLLWETILSGCKWRGEFHNRKKNGDLYWEQALIAPIRDKSGVTTHYICIKEDITERKQLENQLRHSQKMEAIGQLAGGIAHDFNNILTAIIGYSSIIQLKLPNDSPLKKNAEQIVATAERGASLTQGLLAFSRKQAANLHLIDLNEILNRIQQLLLRLISEDIQLELVFAPQALPVMADSVQIEQVLMNLATNARDALPKGGVIVMKTESICIDNGFILSRGFGQPGNYAILTVSDNGEGMEPEVAKHVFEPFFTTKELGKGTGLGLSIVYGIIKKHNGYINCHSTVGTGTTLQIYLPLLTETPAPAVLASENYAPVSQGCAVILVAEDNEAARSLTKEILEEFGYSVLEARDGQEALEMFKNNRDRINLVMLDVIMPKLNGREVFDAVRTLDPSMKVLFCSGYSEDIVIRQGGFVSALDYLPKPYSPKELLMKIREVLDDVH